MTTHQPRPTRPGAGALPGSDWLRRNRLTAGVIGAAVAVIVVAVIVIAAASGSSHAAAPVVKPRAKAPATAGSKWLDTSASRNIDAVNAAVIALTDAKVKDKPADAAAAGSALAAAAATALAGAMPPVDAGVYRAALLALVRAGHAAAQGHLAAAMPLVNDGITRLTKVTASANAPKRR
jgi:hypothetical protein